MKILYGVQATGNGHVARARVMARALEEAAIEVDWILSGRPRNQLFGVERFGNFATRKGLTFVVRNGRVMYLKTAIGLPLRETIRDIRELDLRGYDLVISDFEPVSAWAARARGIPSIGISHQCAFRYPIPKAGNNPVAAAVLRYFAPVRHAIGLHWDSFGHPIIPPLIDLEPGVSGNPDPRRILVYLPFESAQDIKRLLAPFHDFRFVVYCGTEERFSSDNVAFRPYGKERFGVDLADAGGVICNAGFELPSESIHTGKRLLVKPVAGQMEQLSNALALTRLGLGTAMKTLDATSVERWLAAPMPAARPFPEVGRPLVSWLLEGAWDTPSTLARRIW